MSGIYLAGARLGAHLVRAASFGRRWRGLDPDEVYAYLAAVADEIERLSREVATARTEAERVRQGLRQWQSRHNGCRPAADSSGRPTNRGRCR